MKRVLVGEDDAFLASAYRLKLERSNFEVRIAQNGEEVLKQIPLFKPDVVLLDLIMPIKDGFAVLSELCEKKVTDSLPVIVASNLGQEEDRKKAMDMHAYDYVVKSDVTLDSLVEILNNAVSHGSK